MDDNLYDEFGNYIGPDLEDQAQDEYQADDWSDLAVGYVGEEISADYMTDVPSEVARATEQLQNALVEARVNAAAVVLHEDKQHYPSAEEVYPDVEVLVQDEDTQALNCPIITPIGTTTISLSESVIPDTTFDFNFMTSLIDDNSFSRVVAVVGALHHGKTSFVDLLVEATHPALSSRSFSSDTPLRYTDTRLDEQERAISMKLCPISVVLPNLRGKSHLITAIDAPGHPSFACESELALRGSDGAILVVDVVEGVMEGTRKAIGTAVALDLPIVLVLNKIDRLILDLRLPLLDALRQIKVTVDEVNTAISAAGYPTARLVSPILNTVLFASTAHKWCFSLSSFVELHCQHVVGGGKKLSASDAARFVKKLWGDWWFDATTRGFSRTALFTEDGAEIPRAFGHFVLEPLYKIYGTLLGADAPDVRGLCERLKVHITTQESAGDAKTILKMVLSRWFTPSPSPTSPSLSLSSASCVADTLASAFCCPRDRTPARLRALYAGTIPSQLGELSRGNSSSSYVLADMIKSIPRPDASRFDALVRVHSGTLRPGSSYHFLSPDFINPEPGVDSNAETSDDGVAVGTISRIWILQARYRVEVSKAPAGSLVLIEYAGTSPKTATITATSRGSDVAPDAVAVPALRPPFPYALAHVRVGVEPNNPAHLSRVLRALRLVSQCYPLVETQVMYSGELAIFASSELEMDCVLRDVRVVYVNTDPGADPVGFSAPSTSTDTATTQGEVLIKVSDPSVRFSETVISTSTSVSSVITENRQNVLAAIAAPLPAELAAAVERREYGYSRSALLSSTRSGQVEFPGVRPEDIWCFGPGEIGPNLLTNELSRFGAGALERRSLADSVAESLGEGFRWAMQKGPLCDEPVRGVKIAMVDGTAIASTASQRARRTIVPSARKLVYSSMLRSEMRLMEPVCEVEVILNSHGMASAAQLAHARRRARTGDMSGDADIEGVEAMQRALDGVFNARRGVSITATPKPGVPLATFTYYVPLIETFGLETDLRAGSLGQAFVTSSFSHWDLVPGNPLDESIEIAPLKIASDFELARDFMLKTRRRKGLPDHVSVEMYQQGSGM